MIGKLSVLPDMHNLFIYRTETCIFRETKPTVLTIRIFLVQKYCCEYPTQL